MGGAKKKSPAQQEKHQKGQNDKKSGSKKSKKGEKSERTSKVEISVILKEDQGMKIISGAKVITIQELARQTGVKISAANSFLQKAFQKGQVKRVGGHSGHHIYQPVSE